MNDKNKELKLSVRDGLTDFLLYTAPDGMVNVECFLHEETIWLPQKRIAELFGVQRPAITKHLKNIFESGELEENVVSSILEHTTQHGAISRVPQSSGDSLYNYFSISLKIVSCFEIRCLRDPFYYLLTLLKSSVFLCELDNVF